MSAATTGIQDRYPTRVVAETRPDLIERTEPAVWPGWTQGPATPEELRAHEENGFHITRGLLNEEEVRSFRDELTALTRDPKVRADERTIVEKESDEVRSIFEAHKISERVEKLVRDPKVLDHARQILGSDVYVHQSRINYMPGFRGKGFYWHSDFETWHAEDGLPGMRCVSLSVALTDNHPYNGGLMLMPGAHRTFVPCLGGTPKDNYKSSLKEQRIGVPAEEDIALLAERHGIEQFTGPAGSALWFDCNSMHGSGSNITPFPRSNVFIVFNSVENTPAEPFAAERRRPEFIAARDFTPVHY
ncbi:ectoine hydroxylase [Nocardiopsis composta]|uniref:Ectoine hydroxylase n=1 Tax=Nocardiopsis composta TaxID=157465 RepID=A0A7W8VEM0_9ACTN|nr:ectoine hydroxylase [Nocardiopsis composta]MBB5433452.1 ectoine hydroxylase [Nocardiopsis composta]